VCKFTTEAIVNEGSDVGSIHKVCANPSCPVHHPKRQTSRNDEKEKAEYEKQRKEQAHRQRNRCSRPRRCGRGCTGSPA
jgi:ParB family chromosome partitioning protein